MHTAVRHESPVRLDPRYFQIAALGTLTVFGILVLDIGVRAENVAATFAAALIVQYAATRISGLTRFDPLSAVITSLSLVLLLRTDLVTLAALAACLAIGSKFLLRVGGKHVFNPANFAIVLLVVTSDRAWISSGQWGSAAIGALFVVGLGFLVLTRAKRAETTLAFLIGFAALSVGRALWLGDPLAIPAHQLTNGALLVFAFFMISDPKTTPDAAAGRLLYGALVALVAFFVRFALFEPGAPILALIACSPLVPLIDRFFPGPAYRWHEPEARPGPIRYPSPEGVLSCDSSYSSRARS